MSNPAEQIPRISGIRTFARCRHWRDLSGIDAAVVGVPFDTGASYRTGARFGPEAIRSASTLLREHDPALGVDTLETLSIIDYGDVAVTPGSSERAVGEIAEQLEPIAAAGAVPLTLGGDHTIVLAELRALAATHGPLGVVLLDSHADTWDSYRGERYFHGTSFRRAVEEGLVDPSRSVFAGMRGSLYSATDISDATDLGFEMIEWRELRALEPSEYGARVRERIGKGPAFLSFDIDFVDPAFAPATGTPEVGGPSADQALELLRSLAGTSFAGFDVVEVAPPYDNAGQTTSLIAANVAYTMLGLLARSR